MAAPQNWSQTPHPYPGVPEPYNLDIINASWFGMPFYHFRSDWEIDGPSPAHNFYNVSGDVASVGERVVRWSNTYGGGVGDATVDPSACYFGDIAAPRLVEVLVEGKPFKALNFDGRQFLGVNGEEVTQQYDLTGGPLYSTSGSIYQDEEYGHGGASFLFVVSANESMRNGVHYTNEVSPYSALFYARPPQTNFPPYGDNITLWCAANPWSPYCPPGSVTVSDIPINGDSWPPSQQNGLEFWYSAGRTDNVTANPGYGGGSQVMMKFGPQGWHHPRGSGLSYPSTRIPTREENRLQPTGKAGGSDGGFLNPTEFNGSAFDTWEWPRCQSTPKTGMQAILLEFDGHSDSMIAGPTHHQGWPELEPGYTGPTVNVYGISKDWLPRAYNDPPQGCPGFGSDARRYTTPAYTNKDICVSPEARTNNEIPAQYFQTMRTPHSYPALKDQTLWHDKNLFMGGLPAVALESSFSGTDGKYGHGFKGYIFEILMFEGILTNTDKINLFTLLKSKYNKGLG